MAFNSLADFLRMGQHGFYVWMSYGLSYGIIFSMVLLTLKRQDSWLRQQTQLQRREK